MTMSPSVLQKSLGACPHASTNDITSWSFSRSLLAISTKLALDDDAVDGGADLPNFFLLGQSLEKCPTCLHLKHRTLASILFRSRPLARPRDSFSLVMFALVCFQDSKTSIASCSSRTSSEFMSKVPSVNITSPSSGASSDSMRSSSFRLST